MSRAGSISFVLISVLLLLFPVSARGDWFFDTEGGYLWPGYIDVRIPNETGTLFSLTDDLPAESKCVYRLRMEYQFHPKHSVTVLFAPLSLNARGSVDKDISFNEDYFPANTDLRAFYKFNSYRLSDRVTLKFGYRILEGGADVESVYNFTLLNYLIAGVVFRF